MRALRSTAGTPPARKRCSKRCSPEGRRLPITGVRRRARRSGRASARTPSRPASASRCTTAFVAAAERHQQRDGVVEGGRPSGSASGRWALPRERDGARARSRSAARSAPRVDGGDRRGAGQRTCRAPRPAPPSWTPCPSRCSGRPRASPPPRAPRTPPATSVRRAARRRNARGRCRRRARGRGSTPACTGPPVTMIAGTSALAAPISCAGTVLSQPPSSTTASSG